MANPTKLVFSIPGQDNTSQELQAPSGIPTSVQGGLDQSGKNIFQTGLNVLSVLSVTFALIIIMYSGIQWITSGGDKVKISAAKARLSYAVIGLIIASAAYLIVTVIITVFGGKAANFFNPSQLLKP